jgi:hypothetical protein
MVRTGTFKDRPQMQPKAIDGGLSSGVGVLDLGGFLSNRIVQRGRWTVEARPVSGPGLDDLPIHRRTVRQRRNAEVLLDDWARRLESGDSVADEPEE